MQQEGEGVKFLNFRQTEGEGERKAWLCYTCQPMARQRLGQHFLHDADWREQIARAIHVSRHSHERPEREEAAYCWIEIGAGHGEMTEYLAVTGAAVYAIELDLPLIAGLQKLATKFPNLTIVAGDVLETDLAALAGRRRIRLYGNLPYYITSPIIQHFFAIAERIDEIHILIQLEVAQRLTAVPGTRDYGYLSVLTQYFSRPGIALEIPPSAFQPPPEVDSALVTMKLPGRSARLEAGLEDEFLEFVKRCFAKKRKTLVNNLRGFTDPAAVKLALEELQLAATARAEELPLAQLLKLFERFR